MKYLFRGQTRRFGEKLKNYNGDPMDSNWAYGGIFQGTGDFSIIYTYDPIAKTTVYSDTVGMYIGKNDCNGVKIFTGDILDDGYGYKGTIDFDEKTSQFVVLKSENERRSISEIIASCRVVGNIHDEKQRKEFYKK